MDANQFEAELKKKQQALKDYANNVWPKNAGNATLRFIDDNFRMQGWQGASFQPWRKLKKKKNAGTILLKKGNLRRGNQFTATAGETHVFNNVPYAKIHNEGGTIHQSARSELFVRKRYQSGIKGKMFGGMGAFRKGTTAGRGQTYKERNITIPKRQFMPTSWTDSPVLVKTLTADIEKTIRTIFS